MKVMAERAPEWAAERPGAWGRGSSRSNLPAPRVHAGGEVGEWVSVAQRRFFCHTVALAIAQHNGTMLTPSSPFASERHWVISHCHSEVGKQFNSLLDTVLFLRKREHSYHLY